MLANLEFAVIVECRAREGVGNIPVPLPNSHSLLYVFNFQLRNEVNRIFGKPTLQGAEKRLAGAFKCVLDDNTLEDGDLTAEDVVKAMALVETKIGKKRSINLLKFKDVSYIITLALYNITSNSMS